MSKVAISKTGGSVSRHCLQVCWYQRTSYIHKFYISFKQIVKSDSECPKWLYYNVFTIKYITLSESSYSLIMGSTESLFVTLRDMYVCKNDIHIWVISELWFDFHEIWTFSCLPITMTRRFLPYRTITGPTLRLSLVVKPRFGKPLTEPHAL